MPGPGSVLPRPAPPRSAGGAYAEHELDAELRRALRSDPVAVAIRLVSIALVYAMLARAIHAHQLHAGWLWLPVLLEWLTITWIGAVLSRWFVDCASFRRSSGTPFARVLWSLILLAASAAAIWLSARGTADFDGRPGSAVAHAVSVLRTTTLDLALLAMLLGLLLSTAAEVASWKRRRGVFVWMAAAGIGFRLAALFCVVALMTPILFLFGEVLFGTGPAAWPWAWLVWSVLLLSDAGGVALTVFMHRDLLQRGENAKAQPPESGHRRPNR